MVSRPGNSLAAGLSAKKSEQLYGKPWQKEHIKAELYADGIGWVPVDVSVAVDYDKKPGSLEHFGNDPGDFLIFHFDADISLDVPKIGRRSIRFMQEPAFSSSGEAPSRGFKTIRLDCRIGASAQVRWPDRWSASNFGDECLDLLW